MNEKVVETSTKIKIIFLLCILLFVSYFIIFNNNLDVDKSEFIIEGIVFVLAFNTFIISLDFRVKFISMGIGLMAFSLLNDVIDELNLVIPDWLAYLQNVIFEEIFQGIAIIMITYGFYKAIQEKESFVQEMKDLAFNDYLTSLPNRRSIKEKLSLCIEEASNSSGKLGILFVDLDEFKIINDTFGHNIGDDLLKKASIRLRNVIRNNDIVARLGGDEFVIVLHDVTEYDEVECIANRVIEKFKEAFILNGIHIHTSCSIGISVFPDNGEDLDTLFKNADIAMYKAKENGKNNFEIYDDSMNDLSVRKLQVAEGLRIALEKEEFYLTYQPKVDIPTGRITGLEALLRWNHPKFGLLYPSEFIKIAEETGIIKEIDLHVLGLVCEQIRNWGDNGLDPVNIAVNISAQLFNEKTFIERVESILKNNDIDTSFISMEITETTAMENKDYALRILNQLKKHNIQIHLDDFGTGYSSLCYLKTFPVDVLKIDKLFIDGIVKDKKDESIITSLINMAKSMGIKVVSEGVETTQQLKFLKENKCDEYQGFLFSKPVSIEEIEIRLKYRSEDVKTIMSF
ncbi:EAL domain-containing protein [Wukongibacter baidiensis]|uniref:putative bifunctional diguanylate cyclase/phosphodiesterase n=1 Tax=Wukongibacter baidiensis TaxID=1723361 RepID=UPI003D7F55E8